MEIRNLYIFPTKDAGVPHLFIRWANGDEEIVKGFKPYFFIKSAVETGLKSWIDGFPVKKVECDTIFQLERLRKRFEWTGEADVPYLIRYALDMDLKYTSDRKIIYIDIEVGNPEEGSLDTKECPLPISLITVKEKGKTPLTFALKYEGDNTITFDDEQRLLEAFSKYIFTIKPDIIAGWNIISYDLAYLACRMRKLNLPDIFYNYRGQLHIHGTQSFDLLLLYKEYFEMGGRASLQNVAKLIGEEKKAPEDDFISYNQWDTILCEKIDNHYGIIDLMMTFQELAPIHISDLHRSALIDAYILKRARQRGIVMPTKSPFADINENLIGAEILAPKRGVFSNVVFYDIRSAYPNILLKRRICHEPPDQESLFLDVLEEIYETRLKWRALKKQNPYDEKLKLWDKAFKFLLNAQTGQLGYRNSRYYAPHLYNEMTRLVRSAIRLVSKEFKNSILYADSVAADSKILIKHNGQIELMEIKDLFDGEPDYINGGKEYKMIDNVETISLQGEKIVWKPIKHVMRHKTNKRMYRIHLSDDWYVDVTEDHSIYLCQRKLNGKRIFLAHPSDIFKKGDAVIAVKNILSLSLDEYRVKRLEEIKYDDYVYDIEVEDTHNFFANRILVHNTDSSVFQFKDTPEELLDELNALMERENIPLEFEIDKILKKIVFLGKKKNYFGLDTNGKLIYANMYAAQTACPIYCKRVLEEAMMKFLQGATLQEMREFIASKHREIYEVDMEDLTEERNTRKGTGVSFNYKAWLNHKKLFGEAPELPAKLALVPLRNGSWIILTEKSRSYCEENIDREVVFRKWILHPIEEIMKFLYQSNLFGFGK